MIITINKKCPTINHVFGFKGFRKFIKAEGKEFREYVINEVHKQVHPMNFKIKLKITIDVIENWFTKNNEIKRKDLDNRAKFLIDSIFKGLELDDKFIFELVMRKCQSLDEEKSVIKIEESNE